MKYGYYLIALLCISFFSFTFQQEEKTTILFFGDSLTAGMGLSKEQAFPAIVQQKLNEQNKNVEVINAGLSGETSAGGLTRIDWILRKPIDVFVLELGANDALRGLPLDQTKDNLQQIIDKVKKKNPDATIVIAGMMAPPNLGTAYTDEFRSIFPKLAQDNDALLIPFLLLDVAGHEHLNLPDGIHPNVEGHKIAARNILEVLIEVL